MVSFKLAFTRMILRFSEIVALSFSMWKRTTFLSSSYFCIILQALFFVLLLTCFFRNCLLSFHHYTSILVKVYALVGKFSNSMSHLAFFSDLKLVKFYNSCKKCWRELCQMAQFCLRSGMSLMSYKSTFCANNAQCWIYFYIFRRAN